MNDFNKDDMYKAVVEESSLEVADKLFSYIKREYHYEPSEITDACPEFFDELGNALEGDYDISKLIDMADEFFGGMLNERKKRMIGAM